MGFCLLQEAVRDGYFLAVNSSHVEDIFPQKDSKGGEPVCLLKFPFPVEGFRPLVFGSREAIHGIIMKAAKIGLQKSRTSTFIAQKGGARSIPLHLKNTDNVVFVREILPEEFADTGIGIGSATASEMYLHGGKTKIITGRPGVFAQNVNEAGNVPILKIR